MRSCLRRPLAPGRSRVRAIFVSSVMFFSFSSAIVIFTYGIFFVIDKGGLRQFDLRGENVRLSGQPENPSAEADGISGKQYYAARRCGSATCPGTEITDSGSSALPTRTSTSFIVSWMRVFGL